MSDEAIEELVREKFNIQGGGSTHVFSTGIVYDISQTSVIPGKWNLSSRMLRPQPYTIH
ncbi:MAG: hypothetical protein M1431_00695 [Candidatus Thermoplasmatota archaeon]|nr:hypothetical protein [Candidatus Thermoplasmatota archaeon]